MTLASAAQKRRIFALAREHGMDKDLLHSFIEVLVRKSSIRELSVMDAVRVIDMLSGKRKMAENPDRERLSDAQRRYIISLAIQLGWTDESNEDMADFKRLDGFVRKQYKALYVNILSRAEAHRCIEALKDMVDRKNRESEVAL